ncbi:MAG: sulfurtransferase [Actinomyces sp.]|nr:MAG: sulfurtransferase [Actinomyces sp.]
MAPQHAVPVPGPVVDASWLAEHLDDVVVADVRWYLDGRSGHEAYEAGHIPGAVFVDLDVDLAAPPAPGEGRHPLPTPEHLAARLGALGIGDDDTVIAYDDAGGAIAARLWYLLDAVGQKAAVLDGGLRAWTGPPTSGALETGTVHRPPVTRRVRPWPPERFASLDEVARAARRHDTVVIDARDPDRYRGVPNPVDVRPGHIPGAVNVPFAGNLGPDGRFRPAEELRRRFAAVGADERPAIVYCGSGVTACHDLLALRLAGIGDGRLFPGSWSAWESDPDRPVAVG